MSSINSEEATLWRRAKKPEAAFYEQEINALEEKSENIRRQLQDQENGEANAQKWIRLIKSCVSIDRLDRAMAFPLIDNVAVHEQTDEKGRKSQSIQVKYNFVGCLS